LTILNSELTLIAWKLHAIVPCALLCQRFCERQQIVFCGRKKLPFAGYSVVKEPASATLGSFGAAGSLVACQTVRPVFVAATSDSTIRAQPGASRSEESLNFRALSQHRFESEAGPSGPSRAQMPEAFAN